VCVCLDARQDGSLAEPTGDAVKGERSTGFVSSLCGSFMQMNNNYLLLPPS